SGGRQGPLLLLSRDLNGEVQVQYGTKPAAKPLRPPSRLVPVGTPTLLAGEGEQVRVVGMSPGATPWIWRPRATSRA
ncbi:PIG-L family deacetylase, partial [Streptomyces sp. 2MCAF27]